MATATVRATEIAIILIILQASIGFVNEMGIFSEDYAPTQNNQFTNYTVTDISGYDSGSKSIYEQATAVVSIFFDGLRTAGTILFSVVVIYPTLVNLFHILPVISAFLQLVIWIIYSLAIAEIWSGRWFL
jgi:hypothetical protein